MKSNMESMTLILDDEDGKLWLGNLKAANNSYKLVQNGIKTVISLIENITITFPKADNITHYMFNISDQPRVNITNLFETTNQLIQASLKKGGVLVHCLAGVSRSATIVLAYLIGVKQLSFETAYDYVKERRDINPNFGFRQQLIAYSYLQIQ